MLSISKISKYFIFQLIWKSLINVLVGMRNRFPSSVIKLFWIFQVYMKIHHGISNCSVGKNWILPSWMSNWLTFSSNSVFPGIERISCNGTWPKFWHLPVGQMTIPGPFFILLFFFGFYVSAPRDVYRETFPL